MTNTDNPYARDAAEAAEANRIAARLRGLPVPRTPSRAGSVKVTQASTANMQALAAMRAFFAANDQLPPVAQLAQSMGIAPNAAHWHVQQLAKLGHLEKNVVGKWRFARNAIGAGAQRDGL